MFHNVSLPATLLTLLVACSTAQAQPPATGADWALERLTTNDGKQFAGLIESESPSSVELAEVRRFPGKPMNLVVRTIDRKDILSWQRLPLNEQMQLRQRIEQFRYRADIEALRMNDVSLSAERRGGIDYWTYRGQWLSLESTTDEATTRRAIVRIEQVLLAYRQMLPPRFTPQRRLEIMLFGLTEQYQSYLNGLGLQINNPAFFVANFNLVAAGCDINRFAAELAQVRRDHHALLEELEAQSTATPGQLKQLNDDLRAGGVSEADRQKILKAEQRKRTEQRDELKHAIAELDRKNAARFKDVAGRMFTRLYHEAFHAYLENYVFPQQQFNVPRWLNEGLAQTFESGFVEADSLRIDAPNATVLAALQKDLKTEEPLALASLLEADSRTFLATHQTGGVSRLYLYSWGLAYYLTFVEPLVSTKAFEQYVNASADFASPVERFENFVGQPLDEFEPRWRAAMAKLKP